MTLRAVLRWFCLLAFVALSGAAVARAAAAPPATLTLGLASELRSVDPHRVGTPGDDAVAAHVFESLVRFDSAPAPALATSWTQQDDTSWLFTLRRGVAFSDGTLLTADDAAASLRRALRMRAVRSGAGPDWLAVEVVDRSRLRLRTAASYAFLMQALSRMRIVSAASIRAADADPAARAEWTGTGPYRVAEPGPGRVTLVPNSHYGGKAPRWASIILRGLPDGHERVAALLAGSVDAVENIPLDEVERLRGDARFALHAQRSGRLIYLQLGTHAANPPELSYGDQPEPVPNPLLDRRVRRALSEAIDRPALIGQAAHGLGEPAGQLVPPGFFGHLPGLSADKHNLEDARVLLAESGFPNGFALTVHGPLDVYPGGAEVLAGVARMLGEVGVRAQAAADPAATFAAQGSRQQYSAYIRGFSGTVRDATETFVALLATPDAGTGAGGVNWARYSNGTLDGLIQRALVQPRDDARQLLLQEATRLAMSDVALIPLYFAHDAWATRAGLAFTADSQAGALAERLKRHASREKS